MSRRYYLRNLGRSQRDVLHLLAALGSTTYDDLSTTRLGHPQTRKTTRSAVVAAITRLEQRGLVAPAGWTDRPCPAKLWRLTDIGAMAADELYDELPVLR